MLFMLTPEIKTNLILKEIGIKRYSLRSSNDQSHKKSLHFYKKGHILALLDKPYENFVREQQDLLIAIFSSTKIDNGEEVFRTIRYSSNNDLSSAAMRENMQMMCNKITMPSRDINTAPHKTYGPKREMPYAYSFSGEIELTFYGDKFLRQRMFWENWQKTIFDG